MELKNGRWKESTNTGNRQPRIPATDDARFIIMNRVTWNWNWEDWSPDYGQLGLTVNREWKNRFRGSGLQGPAVHYNEPRGVGLG